MKTGGSKPKIKITHNGLSLSIREWSERTGVKAKTIYERISQGVPPEQAILPYDGREGRKFLCNGKESTIRQLSDSSGLSQQCILARLNLGWTIERAVSTPVKERPELEPIHLFPGRIQGLRMSFS